jgi:hypothetical protein
MTYTFFAQENSKLAATVALVADVPVDEAAPTWESFTSEIQRLFKLAIASANEGVRGKTKVVITAERILDAVAAASVIAEREAGERQARLCFGLDQCEAEAQRLFDACMDGQHEAVLSANAERGLMAAYGLIDTSVAVTH